MQQVKLIALSGTHEKKLEKKKRRKLLVGWFFLWRKVQKGHTVPDKKQQ